MAATPAEFRGRVTAADYLVGAGGGELGSLEAGLVGSLATPGISALSGGLITVAGAIVIGAALPGFRRYRVPEKASAGPDAAPKPELDAAPAPVPATEPEL
jgi:hypothetical protein